MKTNYSMDTVVSADLLMPTMGVVVSNNDPHQMGRLKVYCPAIDDELTPTEKLPWVSYASPFGGSIRDKISGPDYQVSSGPSSYGFWAIPKIGAQVVIMYLNSDPNYRIWIACLYGTQLNRSLPGGRQDGPGPGPWTDSYDPLEPSYTHVRNAGLSEDKTRGGYERQVAQAKDNKDGSEGYAVNPDASGELDPQTYCLVTPGHHYITLSDAPEHSRVRMRTSKGNQIILDDTNERIYISTADGNSWIEMDEDGHVHIFAEKSLSIRAGVDINLAAEGQVNINAKQGINLSTPKNCNITADGKINEKSGVATNSVSCGPIQIKGTRIDLNSSLDPNSVENAQLPKIVPEHEPWNRPISRRTRNKHWKAK
jgi:hypothetical protein